MGFSGNRRKPEALPSTWKPLNEIAGESEIAGGHEIGISFLFLPFLLPSFFPLTDNGV